MLIIGCDYHPGFQQIACMDSESGEWKERRLGHREEAVQFYRDLKVRGVKVCVGMEASGHAHWFEHLLAELQFELHIGDAAEIRSKRGAQAEDGSPRCTTTADLAGRRSLPPYRGTERRGTT